MTLSINIFCAVLNYQRINDQSLGNLKCAELPNNETSLYELKQELGFEIDSIAVIKKCNAIMVIVAYSDDLSFDYVKGRLLSSWDKLSNNGIAQLKRDIKFYENIEALKFIAECAVGVHSVTVGDSQVLSQMSDGLTRSLSSPKNPFGLIVEWINFIAEECRFKTGIFNGNTSLERIASDYIVQQERKKKKIMLVGYGKSGKLIAKILNKENNLPLLIVNRTPINLRGDEFKENVIYSSFDLLSSATLKDIGAIVIAINNTTETDELIKVLVDKISEADVIFVDLSTPPLLLGKIKKFIGIDVLSEIAQKNISTRKDAVNKVRGLIGQQINSIVDRINTIIATNYILEQKTHRFSLDSEKINLIKIRGEMFQFIRKFLAQSDFLEVITPSIVGISTDPPKVDKGGTIDVDWMNGARAFLRQSNQIYKQICVASGIKKIYEIGPFWRKEISESY
jgi:glutamyl-tRNA reductase